MVKNLFMQTAPEPGYLLEVTRDLARTALKEHLTTILTRRTADKLTLSQEQTDRVLAVLLSMLFTDPPDQKLPHDCGMISTPELRYLECLVVASECWYVAAFAYSSKTTFIEATPIQLHMAFPVRLNENLLYVPQTDIPQPEPDHAWFTQFRDSLVSVVDNLAYICAKFTSVNATSTESTASAEGSQPQPSTDVQPSIAGLGRHRQPDPAFDNF